MEALDWRMGLIRRGITVAAPRPINLPSQKLENEAYPQSPPPRPPFAWGNPNAPAKDGNPNATAKNDEKTDHATENVQSNDAGDGITNVKSVSLSTDGSEGAVEQPCLAQSTEGSTSTPALYVESNSGSPSSAALENQTEVFPSSVGIGPCSIDGDTGAQVATEVDSLSDSVDQLVSSGCGTSLPSAYLGFPEESPESLESAAKVEEQKLPNKIFSSSVQSWAEECENASSPQLEEDDSCPWASDFDNGQGSNFSSKLEPEPQGSECYGDFYGDYHAPHSCGGMPFVNCHETVFGSGLYTGPCDGVYSSLGVPYYDSTRNKEIIVITMVGNPGFHGNYLPSPGVRDEFVTSAGVYGNIPLQFGQFEHPMVPGPTVFDGRSQAFSGEQGECAYHEEDYLNYGNGHMLRTNVNAPMPTWYSTFHPASYSEDYGVSSGARRQRPAYRTRKTTTKEAWKPERRVTLLTKDSQHELIISSFEKRSKPGGESWRDSGLSTSQSPYPNSTQLAKKCDAGGEGVELCGVVKVVGVDNTSLTTTDVASSLQPTQTEAEVEVPVLSATFKKVSSAAFKKDSVQIEVVSPTIASSTSHAHVEDAGLPSSGAGEDGPMLLTGRNLEVNSDRDGSKHAVTNVTCKVDSNSSVPSDHQQKYQPVSGVEEHAHNNKQASITMPAERLPTQRTNRSAPGVSNHRCNRTWRRKVSMAVVQLGEEQVSGVVVKEGAVFKEVALAKNDSPQLHPRVPSSGVLDAAPRPTLGSSMPITNAGSATAHGQVSAEAKKDPHPAFPIDRSDARDIELLPGSFQADPLGIVVTLDSTHAYQKDGSQSAREQGHRTVNSVKWRQKQASTGVGLPVTTGTTVFDQLSSTNADVKVWELQETASQRTPSLCTCSDRPPRKACSSDGPTKKCKCQKSVLKGMSSTEEAEEQNSLRTLGQSKEQTWPIVNKQTSEKPQPEENNKHGNPEPLMSREQTSTQVQAVHVPKSQATSSSVPVSAPMYLPAANCVKSGGQHKSWRPKAVFEKSGAKKTFRKEVKENDPQAVPHKEGVAEQQAESLPSRKFDASSDVKKGSKTSSGCNAMFHIEGDSPQETVQKRTLDSKGSRSPGLEREVGKAAGPTKQGRDVLSQAKNSGLCAKQSIYGAKQTELNYQSLAGNNRRPFSTWSNFCYDENKALPHHYVHLPCTSSPRQQAQGKDSSCVDRETSGHIESRRDMKLAKRGRLNVGWRVSAKGRVIKNETVEIVV